jgi:glycosyltransferase involved in cell wall biosynthesis
VNIVIVSTGNRPKLLEQSVQSILDNSVHLQNHRLTLVLDGYRSTPDLNTDLWERSLGTYINNRVRQGASASRNIGASSIPKYRRQEYVCFFDDDVYCVPGWDAQIEDVLRHTSNTAVSGHAHPYNHTILGDMRHYGFQLTNVLSTVNIACPWSMWDDVGFFAEPGGPGGSEDVAWCARATKKVYGLAVTVPQCVIHTGVTSSSGRPIVGADSVAANNRQLEQLHRIDGKVKYGW